MIAPVRTREDLFDRPLPDGYRDELRALVAERPQASTRQAGSLLLFTVGSAHLALPTRVASAVAPTLHIARIPHRSGTVLLGLAAFRGDILPCCSLARLLDLPQADGAVHTQGRTLILEETPGRRWAVPIDGVVGIRLVRSDSFTAATGTPPIAPHWIADSFADDGAEFHLLNHEVLFRQINLATA